MSLFFSRSKKVTIVLPCTCLFHSLQKASIPGHGERSPVCFPYFSGGSLMSKEVSKSLFWRLPSAFASWDHTQEFYTNQSEVQMGLCANVLLLLLIRFCCVRLCATPEMAGHQAPLSLGFSRQEHWSGLPFPSPMHESEKWKWSRSVVSDCSDPMDCSLPGSSVHGIFQAKVLEWGAIAFSD